jgi:hypothetical protein
MPKHPVTCQNVFFKLHPCTLKFETTIKPHYFLIGPCTSQLPLENEFSHHNIFSVPHTREIKNNKHNVERKGTGILIVHGDTSHQSTVYLKKAFPTKGTMKYNNLWTHLCMAIRVKEVAPPSHHHHHQSKETQSSMVISIYCIHFQLKNTIIPLSCYERQVMSMLLSNTY